MACFRGWTERKCRRKVGWMNSEKVMGRARWCLLTIYYCILQNDVIFGLPRCPGICRFRCSPPLSAVAISADGCSSKPTIFRVHAVIPSGMPKP